MRRVIEYRLGFGRAVCGAGIVLIALIALAGPTLAGDKQRPGPPIPFENDRAKLRGDRILLKLNDDASVIPGHRIEALPVVDGKIGDRAKLDGKLEIYFPYGRIVTAETEFSPYRKVSGSADRFEPDPSYREVATFDNVLGPVCARATDVQGSGGEVSMRIGAQHVISLVHMDPVLDGPAASIGQKRYRVVSAMDIRNLKADPQAALLYAFCTSGKPASVIARD